MAKRKRRLLGALLVAGSVFGGTTGPARASTTSVASPVQVHIEGEPAGNGILVEARALVAAPLAQVEQALGDVASFPGWLPRMKAVRNVVTRDDSSLLFESTMNLPWPVGEVTEKLTARHEITPDTVRIHWEHVAGDMRRDDVIWTLRAIDAGHTEVIYQANLQFRAWVPVFLMRLAEQKYAPWFLYSLERRAAAIVVPPPEPPLPVVPAEMTLAPALAASDQ